MSKGLEALDHIRQYSTKFSTLGYLNINTDCDEIEQALTELKQIKEAKPSEALESLQKVSETYYTEELSYEDNEVVCKNLDIVEQALLKAQKQEKVLEILKKGYFSTTYNPIANYRHITFDVYDEEDYKKINELLKRCEK